MLLEINDSPQIPLDKRIDLSLDPPSEVDEPRLEIDEPGNPGYAGGLPTKSLKSLLKEVPHLDYAATAERMPDKVADLQASHDSLAADAQAQHPPPFLTADDIDNYIYEIDQRLAAEAEQRGLPAYDMLPTLAPLAHTNGYASAVNGNGTKEPQTPAGAPSSRDFAVKNPVSVYNWLRKHAPKTFLQDGESTPADKGENGDDHHAGGGRGGNRKSVAGERGGNKAPTRAGERKSGRASAAHGRGKRLSMDDSMGDYDDDVGVETLPTPSASSKGGKRKRTVDDDPGYRPKGGSSRPKKQKRKSEGGGGGDSTPTTSTHKRAASRKSMDAAATEPDQEPEAVATKMDVDGKTGKED